MKNIADIIEFIKDLKGVSTDKDVADLLDMTSQSLFNHKTRGSTPYQSIMLFCDIHRVSYDRMLGEEDLTDDDNQGAGNTVKHEEIEQLKSSLIKIQQELLASKNIIISLQNGRRPEDDC